jgi:hypothetical protein
MSVSTLATPAVAGVWDNYIRPSESSWRHPSTTAPCPRIGTQNLSPLNEATILEVAAQICETMHDPRFAERVRAEPVWLANCRTGFRPGRRVTADEVLSQINPPQIEFSAVASDPNGAVAVTNLGYQGIAISTGRFTGWQSGVPVKQQAMVTTLAHEMTHLVPQSPGSRTSLFRDRNHVERPGPLPLCYNHLLVSYDIGRIVGDLWRIRQTELRQ